MSGAFCNQARSRASATAIAMCGVLCFASQTLADPTQQARAGIPALAEVNAAIELVRLTAESDRKSDTSAESKARLTPAAALLERWAMLANTSPANRAEALAAASQARLTSGESSRAILNARRSLLNDPLNQAALDALSQSRIRLAKSPSAPVANGPKPDSPTTTGKTPEVTASDSLPVSGSPSADSPNFASTIRSLLARVPPVVLPAAATMLLACASILAGFRFAFGPRYAQSNHIRFNFIPPLLVAMLGGCILTLAVFNLWPIITSRDVILTASGVQPRSTPTYAASETAASSEIPRGSELRVLEASVDMNERWFRVWNTQSPASAPFWIPADTVEPISPRSWAWRWLSDTPGA